MVALRPRDHHLVLGNGLPGSFRAETLKPAIAAIEALPDRRRRLRRPAKGFHLDGP